MRIVEALVALALGGAILAGAWQVVARQARVASAHAVDVRLHEAVRNALLVLDWEFATGGHAARDAGGGELRLRVFRGWGTVCVMDGMEVDGLEEGSEAVVRWRGLRRPDPVRDSLLVLTASGRAFRAALTGSRLASDGAAAACVPADDALIDRPDEAVERIVIRWDASELRDHGSPVQVRAFETGGYSVGSALRYRRGSGARQPLTVEAFDPARSRWVVTPDGGAELELTAGHVVAGARW